MVPTPPQNPELPENPIHPEDEDLFFPRENQPLVSIANDSNPSWPTIPELRARALDVLYTKPKEPVLSEDQKKVLSIQSELENLGKFIYQTKLEGPASKSPDIDIIFEKVEVLLSLTEQWKNIEWDLKSRINNCMDTSPNTKIKTTIQEAALLLQHILCISPENINWNRIFMALWNRK